MGRRIEGKILDVLFSVVVSNIFYFHPENWGNDPF